MAAHAACMEKRRYNAVSAGQRSPACVAVACLTALEKTCTKTVCLFLLQGITFIIMGNSHLVQTRQMLMTAVYLTAMDASKQGLPLHGIPAQHCVAGLR